VSYDPLYGSVRHSHWRSDFSSAANLD
jgi:hypothetical protein